MLTPIRILVVLGLCLLLDAMIALHLNGVSAVRVHVVHVHDVQLGRPVR